MVFNATNVKVWTLSLHSKGDFFPGFSRHFGSTMVIVAPPKAADKVGSYTFALEKSVASYISTKDWKCEVQVNFIVRIRIGMLNMFYKGYDELQSSFDAKQCLDDYVAKQMGCREAGGIFID